MNDNETTGEEIERILPESQTDPEIVDDIQNDKETQEMTQRIIKGYIKLFNQAEGTKFTTLKEVRAYIEKNNVPESVGFDKAVEQLAVRPGDYVHTLGYLTDLVFDNKITRKRGAKGHYKVTLAEAEKNANEVSVFAYVDYDKVFERLGDHAKIPQFSEDGRQVLDGIISNYLAGNRIMTYLMIYKGFTGDEKCRRLPNGVFEMITDALLSFKGWLIIESNGSNERTDQSFDEPLLMFRRFEEKQSVIVNGREIFGGEGIIQVYEIPVLYRFAIANGNEVDTRPIKLLNVPKINNTPENLRLKRYLYNRIIVMRNNFERYGRMTTSRRIRIDSIFKYAGLDDVNRKNKYKKIQKIKAILDYWTENQLIEGYTTIHKAGTTEVTGIEINFLKKLESQET